MILACDDVPAQSLPATGAAVGVDMGVVSFLTTSDGMHVPNPRPLAAAAARLADAQQSLSAKKRGSKRHRKAAARIAALHGKIRRSRPDHAHKTALTLVREHDVIAHEALKIEHMTRRPRPRAAAEAARDGRQQLGAERRYGQGWTEQIDPRRGMGGVPRRAARQG